MLINSLSLKRADLKLTQAKKEKLTAIFGVLDPSGNTTGSYTNNTQLPVTLLPSEIIGGQPGTFQEVQFGVQHVTNLNAYAEIKLINLQGWENLRLSKLNIQVNESDNKIAFKNLLENAAIVYYNIVNLQEQLKAFQLNLLSADTLFLFTENKFNNGLASIQDLNDSKVNRLNIEESIKQLHYQITQQYIALKILCDIPESEEIRIGQSTICNFPNKQTEITPNYLYADNALIKSQIEKSKFRYSKYTFAPTLSLFGAYQNQQYNTQAKLYDSNKNWLTSNYVGIKLNIPLPTASALKQSISAKYNYLTAKNYAEQMKFQQAHNSKKLSVDYEKAISQVNNTLEIYNLRKETYQKKLVNYKEGILGIEPTTNSFNAFINSQYTYISSTVNLLLVKEKININNNIY